MPTIHYPIRTGIGVGATCLLLLYGLLSFYGDQRERNRAQPDPYHVAIQQQRFEGLKREMRSPAVIGYISDVPFDASIFLSVQYLLAPSLLLDNPEAEWVVGDFSRPLDYVEFGRRRGLAFVKDFSSGVVLFRRAAP